MSKPLCSVGLAALSYALVVLSGSVVANSDTSELACIPRFSADGDCDLINDNEECGYDGGDCCECTCVSTAEFRCGQHGGYSCLDPSANCVNDDDVTTLPAYEGGCVDGFLSDGDCDLANNIEECGYDGGDCCECTCSSSPEYTCGDDSHGGFACIDPSSSCSDDDDYEFPIDGEFGGSFSFSPCLDDFNGDGDCDAENNNGDCGYDGGDCCECDCVDTDYATCGDDFQGGFDCIDPNSPCVNGYVDAGTKTTVNVSANAFDTRPGQASGDIGCMMDGCLPALARDGDSVDIESRWSCARKIVPGGGGACDVSFTFKEAQDIKDVLVSFWRKEIRSRKLQVAINGEDIGSFDSFPGTTFTALGMEANNVSALSLTSIGLEDDEWISLIEVLFLVEP